MSSNKHTADPPGGGDRPVAVGIGSRFEALLQRLKPEIAALTERDLRWARLFYNQGFIEGTAAQAEKVAARIAEFKAREERKNGL